MEGHGQDPAMDGILNGRYTFVVPHTGPSAFDALKSNGEKAVETPTSDLLALVARLELRIARLEKTLDAHGIYA